VKEWRLAARCILSACAHTVAICFAYCPAYRFRARHGDALELLASLGRSALSKSNSASGSAMHSPSVLAPGHAGLAGTEATILYLQELAINIHAPCFPVSTLVDGATPTHSSSSIFLPFSPAASLPVSPDAVIALILHYSKWVILADVDEGLRVFTFCHTMNSRAVDASSTSTKHTHAPHMSISSPSGPQIVHSYAHHQQHCIPAGIVLEHLKKNADREVCIAYLESLIQQVGETSSIFHNELIFLYLESIQKLIRAQEQREAASTTTGHMEERRDSLAEVAVRPRAGQRATDASLAAAAFRSPSFTGPPGGSAAPATRDSSRLAILRRKLLGFLRSSVSYTAEKMLSRFPRHLLLEERAVLLSRINQHSAALSIYAHNLRDPLQAEAYAEEHYNRAMHAQRQQQAGALSTSADENATNTTSSASVIADGKDMYLYLLRVYLNPPNDSLELRSVLAASTAGGTGSQSLASPAVGAPALPMLDAAMKLLSKCSTRIPPVAALESLPASTPLQSLWPYFSSLLCGSVHDHRDRQITKQLRKAEYYAAKEDYLRASQGSIICEQTTTCSACNKKLGNSAFARYPNGAIVHYVCHQLSINTERAHATPNTPQGDL
jgi:hypothetical protein